MFDGKQIKDATITKAKFTLVDPTSPLEPATKQYVDNTVNAAVWAQNWKFPVRVAVGTNMTVSNPGTSSFDGVTLTSGDRVLLYGQTVGSQNGVYLFNGSGAAMTRTTDFDSSAESIDEAQIPVQEGTQAGKIYQLTTNAPITLGTTSLVFSLTIPAATGANPTTGNKAMTAVATTTDFDVACNTGMAAAPANNSYVQVDVNGVLIKIGDAVKTQEAYFSGDSGTTARALNAIASGDKLYWVGSVAGYQLATTDRVSFYYNV